LYWYEINRITNMNQIEFWLEPESRRLELKESWPGGDQVARTAIAFANGAGGKIVFGIQDEPRNIVGVPDNQLFSLEEQIANHIFDLCSPTIIPEIYIQNVEGKSLLVVEVFPGSQKPYYLKKKGKREGTFVRIGSVNRKASEEGIAALERARRKTSFDELPVYEVEWKEIDLSSFINNFMSAAGKEPRETGFVNLGLLYKERDAKHPTNAAVLLSDGRIKNRLFPYAKIECARFKGTDTKVFLDQATVEGPVYASIEPCIAFIKRNIALSSKIGEVYRQDRWEYPLEAIREALTNAVVHRDYSIYGSDIKVAIFDDMLEITSPGPLPDNLPPDALGTGRSEIRNRILAPIFKELGLIEAWGTGIRRMRNEVMEYPDINLELLETGNSFQVRFVKVSAQGEAHEAQDEAQEAQDELVNIDYRILTSCRKQPLSGSELLNEVGYSTRTGNFKKSLSKLLSRKLIEMTIPDKPTSSKQRYRITKKGLGKISS
jgi:ATP-dependent DNA helicase RecG